MSEQKKIAVTGCSRGCGLALIEFFAEEGHALAGCARSESEIAKLKSDPGPPERFAALDVADGAAVDAWASSVIESMGAPDIVVCNAALINKNAPLWNVSEEEFGKVIDVGLKGVANCARAFLPAMIERGSGVFLGVSSYWGRSGSANVAPYCAVKWGVEGLMRALAQDLPTGLCAAPLNPGVINTEMLQSTFGTAASQYPEADEWAESAAPYILEIGPESNGRPLTVPGQ